MSRRDLIIISALVNAGLLVILFASALKPGSSVPPEVSTETLIKPAESQAVAAAKEPAVMTGGDEVDQVLKEFAKRAQSLSPSTVPQEIEVAPSFSPIAKTQDSVEQPSSPPPSFAEELAVQYTPPAPKQESQTTSDFVEVRVKNGDFLDKIARQHKTTVQEIMRVNRLKSTNLKIGQILKIPTKKREAKKGPSTTAKGSGYYTVQNGDNPWTIASKNHIRVSELLRLNNLDEASAKQLKPGDQLKIR